MGSTREHTDREYEQELRAAARADPADGRQGRGEHDRQHPRAGRARHARSRERTIEIDRQINQIEVDIDELCLQILARRQPVASDLRFITMALKLVTDLERIGDLGVNICERVVELNQEPPLKPYVDLPRDGGGRRSACCATRSTRSSPATPSTAQRVIERDATIDAYYSQIFRELLTYMMEDARNIYRATRLQSIAKYLERIADHATNLAEMVVFMVKGKDIRHAGKLSVPREG